MIEIKKILRYVATSIFSNVYALVVFVVLDQLILPDWFSIFISYSTAVLIAFLLNKYWTFKSSNKLFGKELLLYTIFVILGYFINLTVYSGFRNEGFPPVISEFIALLINGVFQFVAQRFVVFNNPIKLEASDSIQNRKLKIDAK